MESRGGRATVLARGGVASEHGSGSLVRVGTVGDGDGTSVAGGALLSSGFTAVRTTGDLCHIRLWIRPATTACIAQSKQWADPEWRQLLVLLRRLRNLGRRGVAIRVPVCF